MASSRSKCGCEVGKDWIVYCPLHAAAGQLLEACQAVLYDIDFYLGRLDDDTKELLKTAITAATKKEGG